MTHGFDQGFWDSHWRDGAGAGSMSTAAPSPYLARELAGLPPGTALDAGCGAGADALWLAEHGWQVTAVDISATALAQAQARAAENDAADRVRWIQGDLATWEPGRRFDLVTTHYAHAALPQLDLYLRLASWVARGGTLLVVGHLPAAAGAASAGHAHGGHHEHDDGHEHGAGQAPPAGATATADGIAALLPADQWQLETSSEERRTMPGPAGDVELHDVVVRAQRR